MDKTTATNLRVVLSGAVVLLLATGVAARLGALPWQRHAAPATATAAVPERTPTTLAPLDPVTRYQVPLSMSQPKRGAEDAIVTIVEWCDFHTPKCIAAEPVLSAVLQAYPKDVRLAFRHFADPSSMPQLEEHEFTRMAFEHAGKFFEAQALLEAAPAVATRDDLARYSAQLGMNWTTVQKDLNDHSFAGVIIADHTFAGMFDVKDIPAFFVNGRRLQGDASLAGFRQLIDDELTRTKQLVANGIPKDKVYAELIKNGKWEKPTLKRN